MESFSDPLYSKVHALAVGLLECTLALGAEMLVLGEVARTTDEGREKLLRAIRDRSGLAKARKVVEAQGGDPRAVDEPDAWLPRTREKHPLRANSDGWISAIDA